MRLIGAIVIFPLIFAVGSVPVAAASLSATSANLKTVFASAKAGDTITLSGSFGANVLADRSFATSVVINASKAVFTGRIDIKNVTGLTIIGGRYGTATSTWQNGGVMNVTGSKNILISKPVVIGDGAGKARGITFTNSGGVKVDGGSFSGLRLAVGVIGVNNGLFTNNRITGSTSDGFNIVRSHVVTASSNTCSSSNPSLGAHPDCIQMWSELGTPVLSDIRLLNNSAFGNTQGFTLFNPERGGGLRIVISGNRVDTSQTQGIACYGCVDSTITDNILTTLPGALFRTNVRVLYGTNNTVWNNSIGPFTPTPVVAFSAMSMGAMIDDPAAEFSAFDPSGSVPEPALWAQMLAGFGLVGALLRRGRRAANSLLTA